MNRWRTRPRVVVMATWAIMLHAMRIGKLALDETVRVGGVTAATGKDEVADSENGMHA